MRHRRFPDHVTIRLVSDGSAAGFGFSVDQITDELPDGFAKVNYHLQDKCVSEIFAAGKTVTLHEDYAMRQIGSEMVVGWKTAQGKVYSYENVKNDWTGVTQTDLTAENLAVYDLYPVLCPISMTCDDVYAFLNTQRVFNADVDGYLYERRHFTRVIADNLATFGLTPFLPVAAVILTYYALYWPTVNFTGSCTGIALTELLQHEGKLDLLSRQGVGTVHELEPDEVLQSTINFYAVQAIPAHMTNHMAIDPSSKEYSAQLHALYDTLAAGKPVYFEFYLDEQHPMKTIFKPGSGDISIGHSIVLTGAYTDAKGNPILIAADNCYSEYGDGTCTTLFMDPDFTQLYYPTWMGGEALDGFSWTEDFSQFDALSIEGTPNPLAWHAAFFRNLSSLLRQILGCMSSADTENFHGAVCFCTQPRDHLCCLLRREPMYPTGSALSGTGCADFLSTRAASRRRRRRRPAAAHTGASPMRLPASHKRTLCRGNSRSQG